MYRDAVVRVCRCPYPLVPWLNDPGSRSSGSHLNFPSCSLPVCLVYSCANPKGDPWLIRAHGSAIQSTVLHEGDWFSSTFKMLHFTNDTSCGKALFGQQLQACVHIVCRNAHEKSSSCEDHKNWCQRRIADDLQLASGRSNMGNQRGTSKWVQVFCRTLQQNLHHKPWGQWHLRLTWLPYTVFCYILPPRTP